MANHSTTIISRSIAEPISEGKSWDERWKKREDALISCWERGRQKRLEDPELASRAASGELVILPWKGGVEKLIKKKEKFGPLQYLAMWQGLRGEDLNISLVEETTLVCARTKMSVVFTSDAGKYGADA